MELTLSIGKIIFLIQVDREIQVDDCFTNFITDFSAAPDVTVRFHWIRGNEEKPRGIFIGQDILLDHYLYDGCRWSFARASREYQACAGCSQDFSRIDCSLNESLCSPKIVNLATLMRFLPMAAILQHFNTFVLHSSQIRIHNTGIVFSAPSGTGKTTQAKLWNRERQAEILCNDRTLIYQEEGIWYSYGYPLDGSEPVYSNQAVTPGCIIFLQQGKTNDVKRLTAGKALACLLSQIQMDVRSNGSDIRLLSLLGDLIEKVPVYQYACTPYPAAVYALEEFLMKEGVISDGNNTNDT